MPKMYVRFAIPCQLPIIYLFIRLCAR